MQNRLWPILPLDTEEWWGSEFRSFFFHFPPPFRSFSVSLGVCSLNFGGVFEAPATQTAPQHFFPDRKNENHKKRSVRPVYTLLNGLACSPCQTTKTAVPSPRPVEPACHHQRRRSHSSSDSAGQNDPHRNRHDYSARRRINSVSPLASALARGAPPVKSGQLKVCPGCPSPAPPRRDPAALLAVPSARNPLTRFVSIANRAPQTEDFAPPVVSNIGSDQHVCGHPTTGHVLHSPSSPR